MVIAESRAAAVDAAELVEIEYDVYPCVTNGADAIKDGAPQVHADAPNNMAFDWTIGCSTEEIDAAIASAAHVTTLEFVNQRMSPNANGTTFCNRQL